MTQILDEIRDGLIRVPRFQRPFVWSDKQRLELLRSILGGTPIGAVMVWRTQHDVACFGRLGPHEIPEEFSSQASRTYLLDGHQRLSTLFAALYPVLAQLEFDEEQDRLEGWSIHYDLEIQDFFLGSDPQAKRATSMPLHVVLDTKSHFKFLRDLGDAASEEIVARADGIAKAIREYKMPVIPVVSDDLESVTRTFQRINSQGTSMNDVHMVSALAYHDDFDLGRCLSSGLDDLDEMGWSTDAKTVLQVCKIVVGLDLYDAPVDQVAKEIHRKGESVVGEAVELLGQAGALLISWNVRSSDVVPYAHQPVLLAGAVRQAGGEVDRKLVRKLERWFWISSFFGNANSSQVQAEQKRLERIVSGEADAEDFSETPTEHLPWRYDFRHARTRAMLLLLGRQDPCDADGESLRAFELLEHEKYKAVGKVVTDYQRGKLSREHRALASGPENRILARQSEMSRVRGRIKEARDRAWLKSHAIPLDAAKALRDGDVIQFLELRAAALQELERRFVEGFGVVYRARPASAPRT
ncbi:MAG: DUF262 domain-containing protein [Deltaproteobacteria bacterium]